MVKYFSLLIFSTLFITPKINWAQKTIPKACYGGIVEYTSGGFGSFNYPIKGDSILISIEDGTKINFKIFPKKEIDRPRVLELSFDFFLLVKKEMYFDLPVPGKRIPTRNYDMKFAYKKEFQNGGSNYTVYLTHFGDGAIADLTVIDEGYGGTRINNLLRAKIIRLK